MRFFFLVFLLFYSGVLAQEPWVSSHSYKIIRKNKKLIDPIIFKKEKIPAFRQLIISYNALCPKGEPYRFFVRICDKKKQIWSPWHMCLECDATVQKTYYSQKDQTENCYVRFECKKPADGFEIKMSTGKFPDHMYIHACCSDLDRMGHEKTEKYATFDSVSISNVPCYSQMALAHPDFSDLCMPTALSMAASYLTGTLIDSVSLALSCYDSGLKQYGSWPLCAAAVYEKTGGALACRAQRFEDFAQVYNFLQQGIPIVVSIRGKSIPGSFKAHRGGHAIVITGFDAKKQHVLCHDPAFLQEFEVKHSYALCDFLRAWEASGRFGFVFRSVL